MKRLLCLLLCLCLFAGMGSALAADMPEVEISERLVRRLTEQWDDPEFKDKLASLDGVDLEDLGEELKALAQEAETLSDEELAARLKALAEARGISLSDDQVQTLLKLLRTYEKGTELKEKAEDVKEKTTGFVAAFRGFAHKAAAFFQRLSDFLKKF